jgi:hypothetical protein
MALNTGEPRHGRNLMILILKLKNKIVYLYRNPPKDGRVICFDEFGPLEIRPQLGENGVVKQDMVQGYPIPAKR